MACEATIYDVKKPVAGVNRLLNHQVTLAGVRVTAVSADGFFVQEHPDEVGRYQGPDYSGLFVYMGSTAPKVVAGDSINIASAKVVNYYGQIELTGLTSSQITKTSAGNPLPPPVQISPAEVRTGGPAARALEGVLVELGNVYVTKHEPTVGPGDRAPTNEFVVDTTAGTDGEAVGVRVDDFLYKPAAMPAVGMKFRILRGVLIFRGSNSKVEPRGFR
jgi:hypothetical protein